MEEPPLEAVLSPIQEKILFILACLLTFVTPLFYIWVWPNGYDHEFRELRIVSSELKFVIFLLFAAPLVGFFLVFIHFRRRVLLFDRLVLVCIGIFLAGILLSTAIAHNPARACVAALKWHLLPLLLALTLAHLSWNRLRLIIFFGIALAAASISSFIALDQHYGFTAWGPGLPRTGLGALLYNRNMAAEYHAPFLPIVLALLFFVRSMPIRIVLSFLLAFILLPALTLSLSRGSWVGLITGSLLIGVIALIMILRAKKQLGESFLPCARRAKAFIILGLALPLYIYTTPYWQKSDEKGTKVSERFESIYTKGSSRRLTLWQDAIEGALNQSQLLGLGSDHYELFFHQSAKLSDNPPVVGLYVNYTHNDYIQTLFENGLLGLLGFIGLWGLVLWHSLRSALACAFVGDPAGFSLRLGLISAILVFLITMFFEFPARMPATIITGWSLLGLLLALSRQTYIKSKPLFTTLGPKAALAVGAAGLILLPIGLLLAKKIFFCELYREQGHLAFKISKNEKSLRFHRESIAQAPWQHRSRTWECFLLLECFNHYYEALRSAEQALSVHPGNIDAHRYRITILSKHLGRHPEALSAFAELEKAAPYHPVVDQERKKFQELK